MKVICEFVPPFAHRKARRYCLTDGLCVERSRSGDRRSQGSPSRRRSARKWTAERGVCPLRAQTFLFDGGEQSKAVGRIGNPAADTLLATRERAPASTRQAERLLNTGKCTKIWKCPRMQAIVRGQVRSTLCAGPWATGSSLLGDEESIVKKSPRTSRPVSTPPINMMDSSFYSLRRGRSPELLIGTGRYFL